MSNYFFSDDIESIMRKQNISNQIEASVLAKISGREKPRPFIVQVVTNISVSDGLFDFPCQFTCGSFRKGSYLRLSKW